MNARWRWAGLRDRSHRRIHREAADPRWGARSRRRRARAV